MIAILEGTPAQAWLARHSAPLEQPELSQKVSYIIAQVAQEGDAALARLAEGFGDPAPRLISREEQESRAAELDPKGAEVLQRSAQRIRAFAETMLSGVAPTRWEQPGFRAGMDLRPVEKVACYAPGGRHPLPSTALMTGLAARAAGVREITLICPSPHPAILQAALLIGADRVYQMGGAQAVAAVALGTASIQPVDMLVGPGNAYVTEAKRQLQGRIGIDMLAGPSEVVIIADSGANPHWLALDLLAQAEHDPEAKVCLLAWDRSLVEAVQQQVAQLLALGRYPEFLSQSLLQSALLLLPDLDHCLLASDRLAPEHLQLALSDPWSAKERLRHYGAVFLGYACSVPFGDYGAGPNHTLPTAATARFSAGLSPLTFLRPQCWLELSQPGALAQDTADFAEMEGLWGHAASARARLRG